MTGLADTIIQGVLLGGLYALFAAGLSLTFGIMRLVNLAHGDLIVLAAFAILALASWLALDPFLAVLVALPLMFAAGLGLQHILLNRTLGHGLLPPLLVTFGLSIIIQNGLMQGFTADSQRLQAGAIETASVQLAGGVTVGLMPLADLCVRNRGDPRIEFPVLPNRTRPRLSGDLRRHLEIAELMGIDHRRIFSLAMGSSMIVATIAALYPGMRANFDPTIGPARLLCAFEAVIIGGLGSFWGTLAGGVIIGLAQTIGAELNPEWQILAGHLAFLFVLALRPRGSVPARSGLNRHGGYRFAGYWVLSACGHKPAARSDRGRQPRAHRRACRATGIRHPRPYPRFDLRVLYAGARAVLESARRLCRSRVSRAAGVRWARRLLVICTHDLRRARPIAGDPARRRDRGAVRDPDRASWCFVSAAPISRSAAGWRPRSIGWCSRSSSNSAAAPGPRCRPLSPTRSPASNG